MDNVGLRDPRPWLTAKVIRNYVSRSSRYFLTSLRHQGIVVRINDQNLIVMVGANASCKKPCNTTSALSDTKHSMLQRTL